MFDYLHDHTLVAAQDYWAGTKTQLYLPLY